MEFVYFLGRFHVLMLHLPVGILCLAVLFEVLVRFPRFRFLEPAVAPTTRNCSRAARRGLSSSPAIRPRATCSAA